MPAHRVAATPKPPKEKAEPKYPHFDHDARVAAHTLWLKHRGAIDMGRLVKALESCFRHDVYGTDDATALRTLAWALMVTQDRPAIVPEWIAADWAKYRRLEQADPWERYFRTVGRDR